MVILEVQISDFRFQIGEWTLQIADVGSFQVADLRVQISRIERLQRIRPVNLP
jgi:hypothetical protein